MNLEKPYQIAGIVTSVAIIVSLAYLAVQVQQNTQAMKLAAGNYAAEQARTLFLVSASPEHRELVFKAWQDPDSLEGIEKFGYFGLMHDYFRTLENVYYQQTDGALDPRLWDGLHRSIGFVMTLPGIRHYWSQRRDWYSSDFQSFVDKTMADNPEGAFPMAGT
jgi:hypothetical protein